MEKMYCDKEQAHEGAVQRAKEKILSDFDVAKVCKVFHMLSDPTRMRMILALLEGGMCVYHLCEVTGGTPSGVSHQLRGLKDKGIVKSKRMGKNVEYSLADEHIVEIMNVAVAHLACEKGE